MDPRRIGNLRFALYKVLRSHLEIEYIFKEVETLEDMLRYCIKAGIINKLEQG